MTCRISRRRFSALAAASGLPAYLSPLLADAQHDSQSDWIDAHVHVWTPDTQKYPLKPGIDPSDMKPPSFTPEQLFSHCRPEGVQRIVLIQMSFYGLDNRYMLDTIAADPKTFRGVAIVDHNAKDVGQQVRRLSQQGVSGFRITTRPEETSRWPSDEGMHRLWKAAAESGLAVCPLINPADIPIVDEMCRRLPYHRVVIDHFARVGITGTIVESELDALCRLARHPNVFVKTSAFYALGKKQPPYTDLIPMIRRVCDHFGPDRLMWASDCPFQVQGVHTYRASISLIRDRVDFLSDEEKRDLLKRTAEKVFLQPAT